MIKINLLPQELSGKSAAKSSTSEGGALVVLVGIVMFLVAGGSLFWTVSTVSASRERKFEAEEAAKKVEEELKTTKAQWSEIEEGMNVMQNQLAVIQALDPPDRLLWTKKLNMLPMLVPENVFLTKIEVKQDVREVETPESLQGYDAWVAAGSKGAPPVRVRRPSISQSVALTGLAYSPENRSEDRLALVTEFLSNLESKAVVVPYSGEEEYFITGFLRRIDFSPIELERIGDREVSKFTFTLNTKSTEINPQALSLEELAAAQGVN
ncbi:MAG: hypothetical protein SF028_15425 [Candidatus Sumerlaeia bacterium]|nr:hypothetical protein [Candidatus Sumerlaeia bacterium]